MATTITNLGIVLTAADRTQAAFNSVGQRIDRMHAGLGRAVSAAASLAAPVAATAAAIGAAAGVAVAYAARQADAIAQYQELSDKIGDTAEQIASLKPASDLSGVAMETIAAASIKLTAALSKTDDESKGAGAAITALGLDFDKFKQLKPVEQMDALAQAFNRFEDGAGKTATAVALFGKSGAEMLPFFKDLAEQGERQIRLTSEQIEQADRFSKQMAQLRGEISLVSQEIATPLISALNDLIERFRLGAKEGKGFGEVLARILGGDYGGAGTATAIRTFETQLAALDRQLEKTNVSEKARNLLLQTRKETLLQLVRLRGYTGDVNNPDNQSAAETARLNRRQQLTPPKTPDKETKSPKDDPIERYLENLQRQLQLTQDLTVEEKLLADIQAGRLGKVTEGQQKELQGIAAQIDAARARTEQVKANRAAFLEAHDNGELKREQDEEAARAGRIKSLIEATPTAKLEAQRKAMDELADAYKRGELGLVGSAEAMARYEEAANTFLGNVPPQIEKMDSFMQKFAENAQDAIGDGLYDIATGNFDNIGDRFAQMITRMIADAQAAELAKWLLGDLVKGGSGDGIFGSILKSFGSIFVPGGGSASLAGTGWGTGDAFGNLDFGGFFDKGTDFVPRDMLAVIHRGEAIVPAAENARGARGGVAITIHQSFAAGTSRATVEQAAAATGREVQAAIARGTAGAR